MNGAVCPTWSRSCAACRCACACLLSHLGLDLGTSEESLSQTLMIAQCGARGKVPGHPVADSELATVELHGGVQPDSAAGLAQVLWDVSLEHAKGRVGKTEKENLVRLGFG